MWSSTAPPAGGGEEDLGGPGRDIELGLTSAEEGRGTDAVAATQFPEEEEAMRQDTNRFHKEVTKIRAELAGKQSIRA